MRGRIGCVLVMAAAIGAALAVLMFRTGTVSAAGSCVPRAGADLAHCNFGGQISRVTTCAAPT